MSKYRLLGVYREKRFSPGMVEKDAAVLSGVLERLTSANLPIVIETIEGEDFPELNTQPDFVLTMAQSEESLNKLESWQTSTRIINSVEGVRNCYRERLVSILSVIDVSFPDTVLLKTDDILKNAELPFAYPVWLKRSDVHAMAAGDVLCVKNKSELMVAGKQFRERGINKIAAQKHVEGEVFKFYGVGRGDFFKVFPEKKSGNIEAPWFESLKKSAVDAAVALDLEIYGGDAVLDEKGGIHVIDMNDWPSFSACCDDAAEAIFQYVTSKWKLF